MNAAWLAMALAATGIECCPFCSGSGKRLVDKVHEAQYVACGRLSNSKYNANPKADEPQGSTDMKVLKVVKNNPKAPKGDQTKLNGYMASAEKEGGDYLIFADVGDDGLRPYSAVPLQESMIEYLDGAMKLENAPPARRLAHFYKYLDSADDDLSRDAYLEFALAPFKDVAAAAGKFDAAKTLKWLQDPNTATYRLGLYGLMVGLGGRPQDAAALKALLDNPEKRPLTGVDGLLAGYCLLEPQAGPKHVAAVLTNVKEDFNFRYAALRAARFLAEEGKADKNWLLGQMATQVADRELGDLVIDDLRKAKHWGCLKKVLGVETAATTQSYSMLRRAAIRFALRCPGEEAKAFVAKLQAKEPHRIANEIDALGYEDAVATPAEAAKKQ